VNRQYEQDPVPLAVASTTRNGRDTLGRSKFARRVPRGGTGLRSVAPAMARIEKQRDGIQLDGGDAVGGTGEQQADDVAPEHAPGPTAADVAETIAATAGHAPDSTRDGWRRVLRFLADGENRDEAVYERARNRLLQFFAARVKRADEELADATFDRVVAKLSDEVVAQVRSPVGYMLRFAHFIYLEHLKSEIARRARLAALQFEDADRTESAQEQWLRDERLALLERCLDELPSADRDLLLSYYTHDSKSRIASRQKLSLDLGITPELLRTRVSRLLTTLNQKVRALAEEAELA